MISLPRCYLFDNNANLITDPDFILADDLDVKKYTGVTMGRKEGEVMKDLIYRHRFFTRVESIDFQGSCSISPYSKKVRGQNKGRNLGLSERASLTLIFDICLRYCISYVETDHLTDKIQLFH